MLHFLLPFLFLFCSFPFCGSLLLLGFCIVIWVFFVCCYHDQVFCFSQSCDRNPVCGLMYDNYLHEELMKSLGILWELVTTMPVAVESHWICMWLSLLFKLRLILLYNFLGFGSPLFPACWCVVGSEFCITLLPGHLSVLFAVIKGVSMEKLPNCMKIFCSFKVW